MSEQPSVELFDTHCHLNLDGLNEDPTAVWQRAREAGVSRTVVVGIDGPTSKLAVEIAERHQGVFAAVGVHPTSTAKVTEADYDAIRGLASGEHTRVVAIGESGLDYYWPDSPAETQLQALHWHVDLALELDLPLVLHIRDAYPQAVDELRGAAGRGLRGIVHCFAGSEEEVLPFLDWNWPISFSGILTYPKAHNVRAAARRTPLDLCLLETDAPWLKPRGVGDGSRINEPANVLRTAEILAEVKGVDLEVIAQCTTRNALRVFGLSADVS